jgi:undecaprenyl-phosphate 4-deoxy-4-formamido-L-arabinose transferase
VVKAYHAMRKLVVHELFPGLFVSKVPIRFLDGYLSWLTSNVSSVKVSHQQSHSGESSYSTKKLIKHFVNIFVTFSSLPIKLLTIISFLFLTVSLFHSFYIIAKAIFVKGYYITGFPTIATMLGFGFGAILFGLGVLGEYIQRINLKTTNRPSFNIIEKIG